MFPFPRSFQSWRAILRFIHCRFSVGLVGGGFHGIVDDVTELEYRELHAVLTELQLPLFITINRIVLVLSFFNDRSIILSNTRSILFIIT